MAIAAGKTCTATALIKRLCEANAVTRALFIVDHITLANRTEDAFAEHLTDFPSYVLRSGRRVQDEKRITITTLQSMINIYRDYSAGYFDLVISDECHRSIYGKWRAVLEHFEAKHRSVWRSVVMYARTYKPKLGKIALARVSFV
jgi:type I restriction enzyme R subunit